MDYNKVIIAGRVVNEVKLQTVGAKKTTLGKFGLCVQVDKNADPLFIDCDVWGKKAETIAKYVAKGDSLLVDGELRLAKWKDKAGNEVKKHFLFVNDFKFAGKSGASSRNTNTGFNPDGNAAYSMEDF